MYQTKYHTTTFSDKSFLITGGAGFIRSNLVEYLLKHGAAKVRVLANLSNGFYINTEEFEPHDRFEFMKDAIYKADTCQRAVQGMDCMSHQVALGSVPRSINNPQTTNDVNISDHLNMMVATREKGIKSFVYAASSCTYGDSKLLPKEEDIIGKPHSPYAITKYSR